MAKICTVVNIDCFLTLNPILWSILVACSSIGALHHSDWAASEIPLDVVLVGTPLPTQSEWCKAPIEGHVTKMD